MALQQCLQQSNAMKLVKDNIVLDIANENHIAAFISSGFVEFKEEKAAEIAANSSQEKVETKTNKIKKRK